METTDRQQQPTIPPSTLSHAGVLQRKKIPLIIRFPASTILA